MLSIGRAANVAAILTSRSHSRASGNAAPAYVLAAHTSADSLSAFEQGVFLALHRRFMHPIAQGRKEKI
jgi:hypothetical protein